MTEKGTLFLANGRIKEHRERVTVFGGAREPLPRSGHLTASAERTCDSMRFTAALRRFIAPSKHKMPRVSLGSCRPNACARVGTPPL